MGRKAYPKAAEVPQDSLAKDQFIGALEDREIRLKLQESGAKTLDEAVEFHVANRGDAPIPYFVALLV